MFAIGSSEEKVASNVTLTLQLVVIVTCKQYVTRDRDQWVMQLEFVILVKGTEKFWGDAL
jgi:hypothetical protein